MYICILGRVNIHGSKKQGEQWLVVFERKKKEGKKIGSGYAFGLCSV